MFQQFYVGGTGMAAFEKVMTNITNNVANSKTVGYKQVDTQLETIFPIVLRQAMKKMYEDDLPAPGLEYGLGVRVASTRKNFSQGALTITDKPFDLAIKGDGLFIFRKEEEIFYSRAGNLGLDNEGNLVSSDGSILEPGFIIPKNASSVRIASDGSVLIKLNGETEERFIGRIQIAKFTNVASLESVGNNMYKETSASGHPMIGNPGKDGFGAIAQYSLESSNVDIVKEMMNMMFIQRAFDIVTKAIQGGEGMLKSATEIARA